MHYLTSEKKCINCNNSFAPTSNSQKKCASCRICKNCGKSLRYSHESFCSISCGSKYNYDNGVFKNWFKYSAKGRPRPKVEKKSTYLYQRQLEMKTDRYRQWRVSVFRRDGFTCQKCNERGGKLNAHHIKRWKTHPELRYELNNGTTLCLDCHKKEHRKV